MAHKRSLFIEALDRSEAKKDGGFKQTWSFSVADGSDEERQNDSDSVVSMDEPDGMNSPEGRKPTPLKHFCTGEPLKTYERRPNNHLRSFKGNAFGLNMLGAGKKLGPSAPRSVFLHGRYFQHANAPAPVVKTAAQSLDLKERKEYPPQIQRLELDSIILTCPETTEANSMVHEGEIKRQTQQKRRASSEDLISFVSSTKNVETLDPHEYLTVCGKCGKPSEDHVKCENCGNILAQDSAGSLKTSTNLAGTASPLSRPSIRRHSSGPNHLLLSKNAFSSSLTIKASQVDVGSSPPVRVTRSNLLISNGRAPLVTGTSPLVAKISKGKRQMETKQHELNDPIVLSSDDEEEEADNASTGSVNRMDSISPRPADSAHSSPAPSGGKVEAAVKDNTEQPDWLTDDYFTDVDARITLPRKARMKDQFGNVVSDKSITKRRKIGQSNTSTNSTKQPPMLESIILDCRSIRIGTLRKAVVKPVIFTVDYIQIETEASTVDKMQTITLKTSEISCCEWCNVRKLPVIFFQTTQSECFRLQDLLQMSKENGGVWYDCKGPNLDEKYIVLIFENGLSLREQAILEEILQEIGKANNIEDFLIKIPFDEANIRLVRFTKSCPDSASKEKGSESSPRVPVSTRLHASAQRYFDDDEEMAELHPTFTGPIEKLIVYPPAPAKGGISVTNEDLHCLNEGEFLNDVIIDFYLKYLVLEKLKKADAQRSHVFSSFFYKRLNQRERRSVVDPTNLPIQKRRHNRVKTWTRHVDLFQKDFIFVPINESAHWFLAVICFPGLDGPQFEPNPLYRTSESILVNSSTAEESLSSAAEEVENSTERFPSSPAFQASKCPVTKALIVSTTEESSESDCNTDQVKGVAVPSNSVKDNERANTHEFRNTQSSTTTGVNGFRADKQKAPQQCIGGLQRIRLCYGNSKNRDDDTFTFSDDQDSSLDESSEDGTLADDTLTSSESGQWNQKPTICKQPCILIMDSLRGPTRSTVVKTLREYLEVEWEVRKGNKRSFGKDVMKGSSPRVPQQDNFSDCGVYILQYVESFFENPLPSFHLPMHLTDWFPQQRMKTKREEIKELILKIQSQQQADKKGHQDTEAEIPGRSVLQNPISDS
ncbi:sentrin-specific protease 6 isoform X2 [Lepisosteus oculatus]|uniref:Sentrin-specific protease 6 n=1 Tax=Lepisosteus oculatus TaxID=7918 RepID=W5NJU0_LEPOC|nr:PREDICTED: sentrin-specific protease 6 isoform X2 [Lepisosteus oculatus]